MEPQPHALVPVNPASRSVVTFAIGDDPWATIAACLSSSGNTWSAGADGSWNTHSVTPIDS